METKKKQIREILTIYILFFLSVIITYKTPQILGSLLQIICLFFFWRSKKDYFWLAFVLIIESEVGFIFAKVDTIHSFSIIPASLLGNLYFSLGFLFFAILKFFPKKLKPPFFLKTNFILLGGYFLIQLMVFGIYKLPAVIRLGMPWILVFIIPHILKSEKEIANFFRLIFPFVILVLVSQVYKIITGLELSTFFGGLASEIIYFRGGIEESDVAIRPVYGSIIPFISIWGSIYFSTLKTKLFSKTYLSIILSLSIFSIFLTASRSWLISISLMVFVYLIIVAKNPLKTFTQILIGATIIIIIVQAIPLLRKQIILSFNRFQTIETFAKGDITAGGTLQRFDVRIKGPMKGFYKSPLIGWGVGDKANFYSDSHVGFHNLLMAGGLIGATLWGLLWLNFINKMLSAYQKFDSGNPYKNIPLVLISFLFSMLIIHAASQWFGYLISFNRTLVTALLFTLGHRIYYFKTEVTEKTK